MLIDPDPRCLSLASRRVSLSHSPFFCTLVHLFPLLCMRSNGKRRRKRESVRERGESEAIFSLFSFSLFQFFPPRDRYLLSYLIYFVIVLRVITFTLERCNLGADIIRKLVCLALSKKKEIAENVDSGKHLKPLGSYSYSCFRCISEEFVAGINVECIG